MKIYEMKNEFLTVKIKDEGAELISIVKNETGTEYLWNGDAAYWKRNAPILFPIVGSLRDGKYTYDGETYSMSQHGFARDKVFRKTTKTEQEIWFMLENDDETMAQYPFEFTLELGYALAGSTIRVMWKVTNNDTKPMFFSIGGHPAFMCPLNGEGKQTDYYLLFDTPKDIRYGLLNENGLLAERNLILHTNGGVMPIDEHLFDKDALIIDDGQTRTISLAGPDKKPYLTVRYDTPLAGIWSPAKKNAPFVCIEPWYGRCDRDDFVGTLEEREYGNKLGVAETFENTYDIIVR